MAASTDKKRTLAGTKELNKAKAAKAREATRARATRVSSAPRQQVHGFLNFIREKGVVGLAVGLAIGTAASGLVNQIVSSVITPLVGLLVGKEGLKGLDVTVTIGDRSEVFAFGMLIDALIKFLALAAVVYFVVLGLKLDKLDKKKEDS